MDTGPAALITAVVGGIIAIAGLIRSIRTDAAARRAADVAAVAKDRAVDVDQFRAAADEWRQMRIEMRNEIDGLRRQIEECERDKVTMQNRMVAMQMRITELERGH